MTSDSPKEKRKINFWFVFFFAGCVVFALWCANIGFLSEFTHVKRGQYGDMFGAVNALFSGLAFAGVIVAILMQSKELELQREELTQTREELKGQKAEFQEQNKTLRQQRFENTFFQMLSLHNEILAAITNRDVNQKIKSQGRDYIKEIAGKIFDKVDRREAELSRDSYKLHDIIKEEYENIYEHTQSRLAHYFRLIYRIIVFVDKSDLEHKDKKFYTDILRAQLSNQELQLLYYNGLGKYGVEKFKPLMEKYELLDNLPEGSLPYFQEAVRLYAPSAFAGRYH